MISSVSVWARCEMAVWEWGSSCSRLWCLSCVCCTGLRPRGWIGQSPLEQGLAWKQSPLEDSKRNATKSQSQAQKYYMINFKGIYTFHLPWKQKIKSTRYQSHIRDTPHLFLQWVSCMQILFSNVKYSLMQFGLIFPVRLKPGCLDCFKQCMIKVSKLHIYKCWLWWHSDPSHVLFGGYYSLLSNRRITQVMG